MTLTIPSTASILALALLAACQASEPLPPEQSSSLFAAPWNSGLDSSEPEFHVQAIDANTIAFRQSLRTSFEAPFLYLIFGEEQALLIDTGVEGVDLRAEIDRQIETWLHETGREKIPLTVMHSHGHLDHISGDRGFEGRPDTEIVGHTPEEVSDFFGLDDWPNGSASYDLGGRTVKILATPGHHPSHVVVFDPATKILFTGDTVYPGRLYFQCGKISEFRETIDKIAAFAQTNEAKWMLGGHIEMKTTPGKTFRQQAQSRQGEHLLELPTVILADIQAALNEMSDGPVVSEHNEFILFPHPADPRGKMPPNWCLPDNI